MYVHLYGMRIVGYCVSYVQMYWMRIREVCQYVAVCGSRKCHWSGFWARPRHYLIKILVNVVRNLYGLNFRVLRTLAASADNFPNRASSTSENAHCALAQRSTETGEKSGVPHRLSAIGTEYCTVYKTTIDYKGGVHIWSLM